VAGGGLGPVDWAVLALIPVIGLALAILTARLTVLAVLRQIL
jgi:cell division transport system permease protein